METIIPGDLRTQMPTGHRGKLRRRRPGPTRVAAQAAALLLVSALLLIPGRPAHASTGWQIHDLTTRMVFAPKAAADRFIYAFPSDIAGEGQVGRVVFRSSNGHVNVFKVDSTGWHWTDVTADLWTRVPANRQSSLIADNMPVGYVTDLASQGQVVRIIYKSAGHVQELSYGNNTNLRWQWADLNDQAGGAPALAADAIPYGYRTNLCGQGPVARVIYRSADNHIRELSVGDGFPSWEQADLTVAAHTMPAINTFPVGVTTELGTQGIAAQVAFESGDLHVQVITLNGCQWHAVSPDPTSGTNAPLVAAGLHAFVTNLPGQDQVYRVIYASADHHVQQLRLGTDLKWYTSDLSAVARWAIAPPPLGKLPLAAQPMGYWTNLTGQGEVGRVVFRDINSNHVWELSVGSDLQWYGNDLTSLTGGIPVAASEPYGYRTYISGQGPVARVVFRDGNGDIQELSVS